MSASKVVIYNSKAGIIYFSKIVKWLINKISNQRERSQKTYVFEEKHRNDKILDMKRNLIGWFEYLHYLTFF